MTLNKNSNHDTLAVFFKGIHDKMGQNISDEFLALESPWFPGVSSRLFKDVKESYELHVDEAVKAVLLSYKKEALMLVNHFQPRLKETLARQRRDYGVDESFKAEHPIADLSEKVRENTPVHNLPLESFSGKVGHRAQKNRHLEATSGSIMIDGIREHI